LDLNGTFYRADELIEFIIEKLSTVGTIEWAYDEDML